MGRLGAHPTAAQHGGRRAARPALAAAAGIPRLPVAPLSGKTAAVPGCGGDAATEWNAVMATAMLAMIPPALVVILMQRWFVKGLVDSEK